MLEDTSAPRDARREARRLAGGFAALVAATFALIVLGALVRAHHAGLACPDWPLCFGDLVPRMDLRVAFEWSHRALAGSVSLAFAALSFRALRHRARVRGLLPLLAVAAAVLGAQILLGALTVWKLLASWTVTSHLLTGNAFALVLLLVAATLREFGRGSPERPALPALARSVWVAAAVLLVFQVALGGLVSSRYAGLACVDWPACRDGVWLPGWEGSVGLHLLHRWNGALLLAALAACAIASRRAPGLRALGVLAVALGLAQMTVGIANVLLRIPVEVTGLHSALAAALVLTLALALREVWLRPVVPAPGRAAQPARVA